MCFYWLNWSFRSVLLLFKWPIYFVEQIVKGFATARKRRYAKYFVDWIISFASSMAVELTRKGWFLLMVIALHMHCTASLQFFEFSVGTNATVDFNIDISKDSTIEHELFTVDSNCIFYFNGKMKSQCLKPLQRERFNVTYYKNHNNFIVTLFIYEIAEIDRGIYLLALREDVNGRIRNYIEDVYVDIIIPPGKAKCRINVSLHSHKWNKVHCSATVGSNGGGHLSCFQDFEKTAFLAPAAHSTTHVRAIFWMDTDSPINCCSFRANHERDADSCTDFVHLPRQTTVAPSSTVYHQNDDGMTSPQAAHSAPVMITLTNHYPVYMILIQGLLGWGTLHLTALVC